MIMKTLCDDKENINRKMQREHGPPLIEMAPLLTSLHENEAGKTGLLDNKMALYERFTVLPHRFAQLSGPSTPSSAPISCSEQSLLKEYHHLSPLSRMPSSLPSGRAQNITCQFFGTTTVCKNKPMDGLGQPMAPRDVLLDTEVKDASGSNLKHTASKTADEFVFSQPSNHTGGDKTRVTSPMLGQGICDTPPADVMKVVEGAQYLSLGDVRGNVSESNQEEGCTCVGSKSGKAVMTDKEPLKVLKCDQDTSYQEQDQDAMIVLSSDSCLKEIGSLEGVNISQPERSNTEGVQFDRPCTNDVQVPGQCCSDEGCMDTRGHDLDHLKESSHDVRSACGSICKIESGSALPGRNSEVPTKTEESVSPILDTIIGANTHRITNQLPHFSVRDKCGACGNNCKCGIVESSQHDIEIGDSSNHSESACALPLSPLAVIQALGQLRFWKTRLALIRQQRIFSDQVFELHKLIEVQRLMAGASNISIDDICFALENIGKEYNADALVSHSRLVDKEEESGGALGKQVSASKESCGFPVCLQRRQPTPASAHQQHSAPYHSVLGPSGPEGPRPLNQRHWAAETPTVSVPLITSQPDMSRHQIKSAYPSSLNSQLHMHDTPHHGYDVEKMSRLSKEVRRWERQKEKKQQGQVLTGKYVDVNTSLSALNLFSLAPILSLDDYDKRRPLRGGKEWQGHGIKVVPRAARSAAESMAGILSIQQERKPQL